MEIVKVETNNWLKVAHNVLSNQKHGIYYVVPDTGVVIVPQKGIVDDQLCYDLGYKVYEAFTIGGVIVANTGDVEIAHVEVVDNDWLIRFRNHFISWLKSKGLNAEFDGNDVLVDGYKICGMFAYVYSEVKYSGVHISMNVNLDHIKAICKKPMQKIPKGLYEYGVTTDEVEQMFLEFCNSDK